LAQSYYGPSAKGIASTLLYCSPSAKRIAGTLLYYGPNGTGIAGTLILWPSAKEIVGTLLYYGPSAKGIAGTHLYYGPSANLHCTPMSNLKNMEYFCASYNWVKKLLYFQELHTVIHKHLYHPLLPSSASVNKYLLTYTNKTQKVYDVDKTSEPSCTKNDFTEKSVTNFLTTQPKCFRL